MAQLKKNAKANYVRGSMFQILMFHKLYLGSCEVAQKICRPDQFSRLTAIGYKQTNKQTDKYIQIEKCSGILENSLLTNNNFMMFLFQNIS